ncbi:MAG: biotin--[acetyl-CoA-carboxylase] ligase [Oscillospiraceae bacterium]|nr:biotin--[acetyl-CoA-carboxylase] ligase [Oscillospiraceae bacterium]
MITAEELDRMRSRLSGQIAGQQLYVYESVTSTNDVLREKLAEGAPNGTVVAAFTQTAGRGRKGRRFQSLKNKGLYFSLLLRPSCSPDQLSTITPRAAVAVCEAIEWGTDIRPAIKWPNDLVCDGRKLCGILTEAMPDPNTGELCVIVGIGINLYQTEEDFGPELAPIAVSLAGLTKRVLPTEASLLEFVLRSLDPLAAEFPAGHARVLESYRSHCLNPGREVRLVSEDGEQTAVCLRVNDDFSLLLQYPDGSTHSVVSGEVSVRGIYGYV